MYVCVRLPYHTRHSSTGPMDVERVPRARRVLEYRTSGETERGAMALGLVRTGSIISSAGVCVRVRLCVNVCVCVCVCVCVHVCACVYLSECLLVWVFPSVCFV